MTENSRIKSLDKRDWSTQPSFLDPEGYRSTALRGPTKPMIPLKEAMRVMNAPVYGNERVAKLDADLTRNACVNGEPIGERIIVTGRVLDEHGRPVRNQLVEIWQANSTGRYIHKVDQHDAPLDPNFLGAGRCLTDNDGRYRFMTIKPGAYPWGNHHNAWRPQHIHFSLYGDAFASRLVTQMYFPGDPLMEFDPILKATPAHAIPLLVAKFSLDITEPSFALGYEWDIVLRGPKQTPMEG
jgi:protocatechuate 3,4-dioxygenase, beta subunit